VPPLPVLKSNTRGHPPGLTPGASVVPPLSGLATAHIGIGTGGVERKFRPLFLPTALIIDRPSRGWDMSGGMKQTIALIP
jgi:hypothetical protein